MNYNIRPANLEDCELLFRWVNDPEVRKASFTSKNIEWLEHSNWFLNKINNPASFILIFEVNNVPVGQIRFDRDDSNEMLLSYLVGKEHRGQSYSYHLIFEGLRFIKREFQTDIIINAFVKLDNIASQKAFKKNGFNKESESHGRIKFVKLI